MMTVLDALTTEGFWGASIIAGWQGIRRTVRTVTVAEVPDSDSWLEGGEIVLTTGYFFREDQERLIAWLESLARGGAVAIAVKRKRFLGDLPTGAKRVLDELNVPLVALRHRVAWPSIIGPVLKRQHFQEQVDGLAWWKDELHRTLEEQRGFPSIVATLANLTGFPVMLQGPDFEIQSVGVPTVHKDTDDSRSDLWLRQRTNGHKTTKIRAELRRLRARTATEPWGLINYAIPVENGLVEHFFPLFSEEQGVGYLSVVYPDADLDRAVLEQWHYVASVISLAYNRFSRARERQLSLSARAFLSVLKGNETGSVPEDVMRALGSRGSIAAVHLERVPTGHQPEVAAADPGQGVIDSLLRDLQDWAQEQHRDSLTTYDDGVFFFLLPEETEEEESVGKRRQRQSQWVSDLTSFVAACKFKGVRVGISETGSGRKFYQQALGQSLDSVRLVGDGARDKPIVWYDDLGMIRLVADVRSMDTLEAYVRQCLGPLLTEQERGENDLLHTLQVFFDSDGNSTKTAEHLFIHRNTLRYRLKRIEELTGLDPRSSEGQATLYMALQLQTYLRRRKRATDANAQNRWE